MLIPQTWRNGLVIVETTLNYHHEKSNSVSKNSYGHHGIRLFNKTSLAWWIRIIEETIKLHGSGILIYRVIKSILIFYFDHGTQSMLNPNEVCEINVAVLVVVIHQLPSTSTHSKMLWLIFHVKDHCHICLLNIDISGIPLFSPFLSLYPHMNIVTNFIINSDIFICNLYSYKHHLALSIKQNLIS